jgi:hypothetical protein
VAIKRRPPDPDGITTAQLAGTAGRYVSRRPLDVEAAVAELREIADGRGDLLAERAGLTLGFYARDNRDEWSRKALQAALLIAAGADLTRLMEWIAWGRSGRNGSARRGAQGRPRGRWPYSDFPCARRDTYVVRMLRRLSGAWRVPNRSKSQGVEDDGPPPDPVLGRRRAESLSTRYTREAMPIRSSPTLFRTVLVVGS